MDSSISTYYRIAPHSIGDRAYWQSLRADPRHAALFEKMEALSAAAPAQPPIPLASDYLAARRSNNRKLLDHHWQQDRTQLTALALRRCVRGLEADDPDDQLLNWLWAFLTEPSWAVSAHLPGNDLPASGKPYLDLAACEMAAALAEMREVLKPWMDSVSNTLADSVIAEIDERVLEPYGDGVEVWWQSEKRELNNWLGVCAGSILAACESLAAQGQPRPKARARALKGLRLYVDQCFSEHGECDEGLSYWVYGLTYACLGWSRLTHEEFTANVDVERLRLIADYPRSIHLFDNYFFSGNDATLHVPLPLDLLPWLAAATGTTWLLEWGNTPESHTKGGRSFGQLLRMLEAPHSSPTSVATNEQTNDRPQHLPDQQVAILRAQTPHGELLAALSGGHNAERHNHNDLGHFIVAANQQLIVPDLGAPEYTADFFGPRRYTYLPASSRGHCCPLIGDFEQRAGAEAAGKILSWTPKADEPKFILDLTAAYPPEAGLISWTRGLEIRNQGSREFSPKRDPEDRTLVSFARMIIADHFHTQTAGQKITHVIWSLEAPHKISAADGHQQLGLGPLTCELAPAPSAINVVTVAADDLHLREFVGRTLYRVEVSYHTDTEGKLDIETAFFLV